MNYREKAEELAFLAWGWSGKSMATIDAIERALREAAAEAWTAAFRELKDGNVALDELLKQADRIRRGEG